MSRSIVIGGLLVFLLLTVAVLVLVFEPVEEEVQVGASGMAALNRFYAAERMLSELGTPAQSVWSIQAPPRDDVLLVLLDNNAVFRGWAAEHLPAWVADGGHLLVAAPIGEEAPLLDALGIERNPLRPSSGSLSRLPLRTGQAPVAVDNLPLWSVSAGKTSASESWVLTDEDGTLLKAAVTFPYSDGWVGVVGGGAQWSNAHIGDAAHATWLWQMVRDSGAEEVVIVLEGSAPSLWSLLWRHGRAALISLAMFLLAMGWRASHRFGPMRQRPSVQRRQLLQHVEASGAFLWRSAAGREALVHSARRAAGTPVDGAPIPTGQNDFMDEMRRHQPAWRKK